MPKKIKKQVHFIENNNVRWVHGEERWIRNGVRVNQKKIHQKEEIFLIALAFVLNQSINGHDRKGITY